MDARESHTASRGKFLGAAGLTGAALASGAWRADTAGAAPRAAKADKRSYAAGRFLLSLDGESALLEHAEGGDAVGEVVLEGHEGPLQKKHIGNVRYQECTIELGLALPKSLQAWIQATLDGKHERKSGALVSADFDYRERSVVEFEEATITAVGFPALDAASKETAYLTVGFAPELTRRTQGSGEKLKIDAKKQKQWLPANFRLAIDGLETKRVSKVDALTIKQSVATGPVGEQREPQLQPGKLEYPNLVVTLPEADGESWYAWHEDFVLRGNNSDEQERTGTLTFLAPNGQEELARLAFTGLGIVRVAPERLDAGTDTVRRITAELYCERIGLTLLG